MTGHAEAVQGHFDPQLLSYRELLELFFAFHDPTTLNAQGPDQGTQYRSAIFYHTPEQKAQAEQLIQELERSRTFDRPIVTQVVAADTFYPAEQYHQDYYRQNPDKAYCRATITPKLAKLRLEYAERLKQEVGLR
jgi:peptide-methionine (S)-S-oxide reductase